MTQLRLITKALSLCVLFCLWLLQWQLNAQVRDGNGPSASADHRCGKALQSKDAGPADWAPQMRKRGIKAVDADASFTWNHGIESVSITNLRYYSAYSGMGAKLLDTLPSADAFSKELAAEAGPILTEKLQDLVRPALARLRIARARGSMVVTLFDDPCIPAKGTLGQLEDPDLSPLIVASSSHSLAAFNAVLKQGADVNAHDQKGLTPLMAASFAGDVEMVKLLLEHGARVNDQDIDGRTALDYAKRHLRSGVIPLLERAAADANVKLSPTAKP
jgi:Ankyrin repeats (3 copies)